MEGYIPNQQKTIQTSSDVLWTMQLAKNLSKNDEQHFLGITSWRRTGKLHEWFRDTSKDNGRTERMNNQIHKDSGETQFVF